MFNCLGGALRAVQSNDMMMSVYLASIMRAVVSLHALIENKEARVWADKKDERKENEAPKNADKADENDNTDASKASKGDEEATNTEKP